MAPFGIDEKISSQCPEDQCVDYDNEKDEEKKNSNHLISPKPESEFQL